MPPSRISAAAVRANSAAVLPPANGAQKLAGQCDGIPHDGAAVTEPPLPPEWLRLLRSITSNRLEHFGLPGCRIGPAGLEQLKTLRWVEHLRSLDLKLNALGDAGMETLAALGMIESVEELNLSGNEIGDEGVTKLLGWPGVGQLKKLDLLVNRIADAGAQTLAGACSPP